MLKTFAINLKPETFTEFVTCNNFNVMNGAIMFMNYHEAMIKIASRTVLLSIFNGILYVARSKSVKGYVIKSGFFSIFVSGLSEKLSLCDRLILSGNVSKLESTLSEISEDLYYINDILELQIKEFNDSLCNTLIKSLIYPVVISSLGSINHSPHHLSIPLSGTFLYYLLKIVKNPSLANTLTMGILSKLIPEDLSNLLQEAPSPNLRQNDQYIEASSRFLEILEGFPTKEKIVPNQVPDIIFSFLTSKDNNLIGTTLILIHTVINCVSVSNNLLLASGLIPYEKLKIKNLLSTILETQDSNASYSEQVVEALISLLGNEHPLQLFLFKLACKVLVSLTFRKNQTICLSQQHQMILNAAFLKRVQNLQEFLNDSSEYDEFFELFESEWKTLSVPEPKLNNFVHLLLPYNEELEGVPLEYRNPLDESEAFRCEIQRLLAIWSAKFALCKDRSVFSLDIYPLYHLSNAVIWEKGKSYYLKNKNLVKCVAKLKKNEQNLFYASDDHFFLLVIPDPKYEDFYIIKFVESILNVETIQDRADPRRLVLMINSSSDPFELLFADTQQCLWTLREISGSKNSCRELYIKLTSSLFDQFATGLLPLNT